MFNPHTYHNSNSAGAAYMEVVQRLDDDDDHREATSQPVLMPLKGTELTGSVTGPVARLQLRHTFGHPDGAEGPVLEAVYRFPLPGDAAVTGVVVTFGETRIRAELADRRDAEAEYDHARRTGHQAILLTRESPDVFSLHISGIGAGKDVEIVTDFVQSLQPAGRSFTLRVPLTVTPRFTSAGGRGGRHEHGQPLSLAPDPGHRFALNLNVIGAASVSSSTHSITQSHTERGTAIALSEGETIPDRDLVLEIAHAADEIHPALTPSLQVFHYPDHEAGHDYLLALVEPPAYRDVIEVKPREIILLVDRSGSMSGPKWEAADWAVQQFLSGLLPQDQFSVGLFHSTTRWFSRVSVPATPEYVEAAREFVEAYDDSGGTHLELALEEAISCGRASGDLARHIVIITDAQVSNARDNLALARAESERSTRRRISMLCIDAAPNSWLVHELVALGGGQATFLTSDPEEEDITTALDDVMAFWDQPVETGMGLTINRDDVWVMGRPVKDEDIDGEATGTIDLGDLPAGHPLWVAIRTAASSEQLKLDLRSHSGTIIEDFVDITETDDSVKKLFGARRLTALEFQLEPMFMGWRRRERNKHAHNELRRQLVNESLNYGLACSETSFVAVREEAGQLVQRGAIVPNALAAGWSDEFAAYKMADIAPASMPIESRASINREFAQESGSFEHGPLYSMHEPLEYREFSTASSMDLFTGRPDTSGAEVTLFELDRFGKFARLTALRVVAASDDGQFDGDLLLYIGDRAEPRARIRLRDVLDHAGRRPLNLRVRSNDSFRLVFRNDTPGKEIPEIAISLDWE